MTTKPAPTPREIAAYTRDRMARPGWAEALLRAAEAWQAAGRLDIAREIGGQLSAEIARTTATR